MALGTSIALCQKMAPTSRTDRGIGRASCIALAKLGCAVAVAYGNNREKASDVVRECERAGVRAAAFKASMSSPSEISALVKDVEAQLGPIEYAILC